MTKEEALNKISKNHAFDSFERLLLVFVHKAVGIAEFKNLINEAMDEYARQEVKDFAEWLIKEEISILDEAFWKYPFTDQAEDYTVEKVSDLYQQQKQK